MVDNVEKPTQTSGILWLGPEDLLPGTTIYQARKSYYLVLPPARLGIFSGDLQWAST